MFKERLKTHHSAMADAKRFVLGRVPVVEFLNEKVAEDPTASLATIYIHVPFCSKICSFCNMRRSLQEPRANYHRLVIKEIEAYAKTARIKGLSFDAIYFGGGTPTTLKTEALREILRALKANFTLTQDVEITIETTVTELAEDKLLMFKEEGVNRFSVGVQTFNDRGRQLMGRVGSGEVAYNKLKQLKAMGFETVSMDLIYNYPDQTKEELLEDLKKIEALELDGFSMYSLIDMKESRIDKAQGINSDDVLFNTIADYMEERGYKFLELTKMVKSDRYKYVMNRHRGADTLALGAGAGGNIGGMMIMNEINLDKYSETVEVFNSRASMLFSPEYKALTLFKGAMQVTYLPEEVTDDSKYRDKLKVLLEEGYVEEIDDRYRMTRKGIFWGNNISRMLYDERMKQH